MKLHCKEESTRTRFRTHTQTFALFFAVIVVSVFHFYFCFYVYFSKDEDISVVFGAKNLKNYTGQLFSNVSIHKKNYDR